MNTINTKNSFRNFAGKPFRANQEEAINRILESKKRYIVLIAPTGSGKSLIGSIVGKIRGEFTYLCNSKPLQKQLHTDYPEADILFGRANYKCTRFDTTYDRCPIKKCAVVCGYKAAKARVLNSKYRILNYPYFLTEANYVGRFSRTPYLIADEGDMLERVLTDFVTVTINEDKFKRLRIALPKRKTATPAGISEWKMWSEEANLLLQGHIYKTEQELIPEEDIGDNDTDAQLHNSKLLDKINSYRSSCKGLTRFMRYVDETWLRSEKPSRYGKLHVFEPIWLKPNMFKEFFDQHILPTGQIVLMSATFMPVQILAMLLGISVASIEVIDVPSTFPVENRRIFLQPVGDLSYKTFEDDVEKIIKKIYEIMNKYPNDKGIIHCVSYKLRDKIIATNVQSRLIYHNADNRQDVLDTFKASKAPLVLISPSLERGVSLDDDHARFCIIAKAPYLSLADKKVSARVYGSDIGNLWYKMDALQTIIQMCGRAVRSKDDYATTYIIEKQACELVVKNVSSLPGYFREALKQ